ncbi:cytochrome c [Bradyrhizobium sp.]|uniref:c-type cytochrome n=1 Tax=Bradyrhizobium sp. TaxID=376 RepID=UPI0025C2F948|nr:cytochrome c [Bradyrhizobium sp.]
MSTRKLLVALGATLALSASTAVAQSPGLGKNITEADIKAWDIAVLPDGSNLPPGSGTVAQGAAIYKQQCALCHGEGGVKPAPGYAPMVGLQKWDRMDAPKTITYYEFATTIFDQVRRGMPYMSPRTLNDDQVYAVTAYLLAINKLIGEGDVMDAKSLPKVKMPNAGKFIIRFPDRI